MIIGLLVDCGRIHLTTNPIELQASVDVVAQDVLQIARRRFWVEPGIVEGWIQNERLAVVDLVDRAADGSVMIVQLVISRFEL